MTPRTGFEAALERAKHQLKLYELIRDTRQRSIRSDWAASFRRVMHWPAAERLVRVDGHDSNSILVFRESCGISRQDFGHRYVSELLRNSIVASISALDRMLHDHIVKHSWKLLSRNEQEVPKKLKTLTISALDARKALEKLRRNQKSRPGNAVKAAIQERLHREYTFQSPDGVLQAAKMLGIDDFWGRVAREMSGSPTKDDVISTLRAIAVRRNQIVHEADLVRTNRQEPALRAINVDQATQWVKWIEKFGLAIDEVVRACV